MGFNSAFEGLMHVINYMVKFFERKNWKDKQNFLL